MTRPDPGCGLTEDPWKASRLELRNTITEARETIRRDVNRSSPVHDADSQSLGIDQINFDDPIFDSIWNDYPDGHSWRRKIVREPAGRLAFIRRASTGSYSAVAILKFGEGPSGPAEDSLKISTFKVAANHEKWGLADILLTSILVEALDRATNSVFIGVLPGHEDIVRYLEVRGFRREPIRTTRGEFVYSLELSRPGATYARLNRLAYDLLASSYELRVDQPGASQETADRLAGLLLSHVVSEPRILELGPGSGEVLEVLARSARSVAAVELSERMADLAYRRVPSASILIADAMDVRFPQASFDGIYAGAFIHLFPEIHARELLNRVLHWLAPGGALFVNTSLSTGGYSGLTVKDGYVRRVARYREHWTDPEFYQLLRSTGFEIVARSTTDEYERSKYWVAYVARRPKKTAQPLCRWDSPS